MLLAPDTPSVAELRAAHDRDALVLSGPGPRLARVGDLVIDGPHGWLPLRVYAPSADPGLPVVAYLHGGGWTVGSIASFDGVARTLAVASGALVVSIGYGAALRAAGVRATIRRYPGTVHGFWRWLARSQASRRAVGEVGAALRAAL